MRIKVHDKPPARNIHGIVLLDKRLGVSSNRALQEVKRLFNAQKAGHTGSLDPLATGLLPICFGAATRISGLMLNEDKRYQTVIQLGINTDTGDLEGKVIETRAIPDFALTEIKAVLQQFIGEIDQVPPMYSALKLNGKKLYELARDGITVERKARKITIYDLQLINLDKAEIALEVHCSKGTYIRTLAEDIGEMLGCGATVKALRRIQTGEFRIDQAITLEQLQQMDEQEQLTALIPIDAPLQSMPSVYLDTHQAAGIQNGQLLNVEGATQGSVRMYHSNQFLGLGEMRLDGKLAPKIVFNFNDKAS